MTEEPGLSACDKSHVAAFGMGSRRHERVVTENSEQVLNFNYLIPRGKWPVLRRAAQRTRTALMFRSYRAGDHITLLGRGKLYADERDMRGHRLLESGGPIYPWPVLIWAEIARRLQPTLFLDIGANYGEIGLSLRYRSDAKVYLFEPNPRILPYLKRSISEHCNADQITLVPAFVSDQPGVMTFKANKTWSGVSYGADDNAIADEKFEIMSVPAMTIDGLMATLPDLHSCRLQFKIDVEGFERRVLLGMRRVLSEVSAYVGILEFDAAALARARTDARLFFDELTSLGRLWEVNGGLIRIACFERLRSHTDLIIASPTSFDHFALPALVRMFYRLNRGEPKRKDMEGACHGPR